MKLTSLGGRNKTRGAWVAGGAAVALLALGTAVLAQTKDAPKSKATAKSAPTRPDAKPDANGYIPQFSIEEIMEAIVMPAAQGVWDAVAVDVTEHGTIEKKPQTDEDWEKLREVAIALAESTNLVIVPGRHAARPGAHSENPESELEPEQIDALLKSQRAAFVAHAEVLHAAAMEAVHAIDAHNIDGISEAGGTIDAACESCHLQFWYPNQQIPK